MIFTLFLALILSAFVHCDPGIGLLGLQRMELLVENVGATEVWMRLKVESTFPPLDFVIERDGQQVLSGRMFKLDTLVIDTTAQPKRNYVYKAIQMRQSARTLESEEVRVITLDTTSHAITWHVDTLGVRGTIFDVWAFSSDNIWAVGEIFVKDPNGNEDPVLHNLAQWDGQKWTISKVVGPRVNAIFAFSPSDVWIGTSAPYHWDGQQWRSFNVSGIFNGFINKIWGTSSNNVFIVGTNGSLARYNGSTWQRIESGTTVNLEDIWGIDGNNIWATGTEPDYSRSVILRFGNGGWSTLFDSFGQPREQDHRFRSVWTDNPNLLFLAGLTGRWSFNLNSESFRKLESIASFVSFRIRATGQNDIFVANQGSELLHYNGSSWYLYPEIKALDEQQAWWYSIHAGEDFVIVGGLFFTGLHGVPVVLRGSR